MLSKNTVRLRNTVAVLMVLAVFFISVSGIAIASATTDQLFPCDCEACTDGTTTTETTVDCTASGCENGTITTEHVTTCPSCNGETVLYSSTTNSCSTCGGDGLVTTSTTVDCSTCGGDGEIYERYYYDCTSCGGDGIKTTTTKTSCTTCGGDGEATCSTCDGRGYTTSFSSGFNSCPTCGTGEFETNSSGMGSGVVDCDECGGDGYYYVQSSAECSSCGGDGEKSSYRYVDCTVCDATGDITTTTNIACTASGCVSGTITTIVTSDCTSCTDGNNYSYTTADCTVCGGDGEIVTTTTVDCETCGGTELVYIGLTDITTISNVLMSEGSSTIVSFNFEEVGDIGELEYVWYINETPYVVTTSPTLEIKDLATGVYGVYCEINSSKDFTVITSDFELQINPANERNYIDIISQPNSYTFRYGELISIQLTEENATDITWWLNGTKLMFCDDCEDLTELDLSTWDIGIYEVYCVYTLNDEEVTSDIATITIIDDLGITEEVETVWDNISTGFWVAIGATLAAALVAIIVAKGKKS